VLRKGAVTVWARWGGRSGFRRSILERLHTLRIFAYTSYISMTSLDLMVYTSSACTADSRESLAMDVQNFNRFLQAIGYDDTTCVTSWDVHVLHAVGPLGCELGTR